MIHRARVSGLPTPAYMGDVTEREFQPAMDPQH
jgi:hypothetical protein